MRPSLVGAGCRFALALMCLAPVSLLPVGSLRASAPAHGAFAPCRSTGFVAPVTPPSARGCDSATGWPGSSIARLHPQTSGRCLYDLPLLCCDGVDHGGGGGGSLRVETRPRVEGGPRQHPGIVVGLCAADLRDHWRAPEQWNGNGAGNKGSGNGAAKTGSAPAQTRQKGQNSRSDTTRAKASTDHSSGWQGQGTCQGARGGQQEAWRAKGERGGWQVHDTGGISHAKSGQTVEVRYENDWRVAVIVGLTPESEIVVQYVGGNEHCRETIDMRSKRLRAIAVQGSGTSFRTGTTAITGGLALQLEWCSQIAADADEMGRYAYLPLVASQSAIGWRRRREDDKWFGSWSLPGKKGGAGLGAKHPRLSPQLPRDLASFSSLVNLLDALEAAVAVSPREFGAKQSVIAMNHIKRLSWQCERSDSALAGRTKYTMRHFAEAAATGMDRLSSKDIALLLNAVTSVLDVRAECPGLRTQSEAAKTQPVSASSSRDASSQEMEPSRESCVFWGLFDKASRRLLRLDTLYTAHAMAGVTDFDNPGKFTSQGVAMVANALSHAGIRDEELMQMLSSVVREQLSTHEYTAQSVSLIAAAFEILSFKDDALFARLAHVAVEIPARSFDGQALSSFLWSMQRTGHLATNTLLLHKAQDVLRQMPLKKWTAPHLCRALQAISAAHATLLRSTREGVLAESAGERRERQGIGELADVCTNKGTWKDPQAAARTSKDMSASDEAAAKQVLDHVASALFGYVSHNVANGAIQFDTTTSPTMMVGLAAECVRANEQGWVSMQERDAVLHVLSLQLTSLAGTCVHVFSHKDIAVLLNALSRARSWEGAGSRPSHAPDLGTGVVRNCENNAASTETDSAIKAGVWASMIHVLAVLPVQRASVRELVSLLESVARGVEAGVLLGCRDELAEVVGILLQHVSRAGMQEVSPSQVAAAVVAAARCGVREEDSIRRLTATAQLMLTTELECVSSSARDPTSPSKGTVPKTSSSSRRAGVGSDVVATCPFPHHLISGVGSQTEREQGRDVKLEHSTAQRDAVPSQTVSQHMSQDDIGALLRAAAYLNIVDRTLLTSATSVLLQRTTMPLAQSALSEECKLGGGKVDNLPQSVANVAWAAAVMGGVDTQVHTWLADTLRGPCLEMLSSEQLVSVHQYLVEYELLDAANAASHVSNVPCDTNKVPRNSVLATKCRGAMDVSVASAQAHSSISSTQRQVMEQLRSVRLPPQEEFVDETTGYSIDGLVAMPCPNISTDAAAASLGNPAKQELLVAIEVDGPSHFAYATPVAPSMGEETQMSGAADGGTAVFRRVPLGATAMKRRHLVRAGYTVVSVPFWEWDALNKHNDAAQRTARQRYLQLKFRALGVMLSDEEEK